MHPAIFAFPKSFSMAKPCYHKRPQNSHLIQRRHVNYARYAHPAERNRFTARIPSTSDAAIAIDFQQTLWKAFFSDSPKCDMPTNPIVSQKSRRKFPEKRSKWADSLKFISTYAPSLPSQRLLLSHWIRYFAAHTFATERSAEAAVRFFVNALQQLPANVVSPPLLEVAAQSIESAIVHSAAETAQAISTAVATHILEPTWRKIDFPENTERTHIFAENSLENQFQMHENLIRIPSLFLDLLATVLRHAKRKELFNIPADLPRLISALHRRHHQIYTNAYVASFGGVCAFAESPNDDFPDNLWAKALRFASLTAVTATASDKSPFSLFQSIHENSMAHERNCFFIARTMLQFPGDYWQDALQLFETGNAQRGKSSPVVRLLFCASAVQVVPASQWLRVLRLLLPKNTEKKRSDREIAVLVLRRLEMVCRKQCVCQSSVLENASTNSPRRIDPFAQTAADFDFVRLYLRRLTQNTQLDGDQSGVEKPPLLGLSAFGKVSQTENMCSLGILTQAISPRTISAALQRNPSGALSGDNFPHSMPKAMRLWVSALSLLSVVKSGVSSWETVLSKFQAHISLCGEAPNALMPLVENLFHSSTEKQGEFANKPILPKDAHFHEKQGNTQITNPTVETSPLQFFDETNARQWTCGCDHRLAHLQMPFGDPRRLKDVRIEAFTTLSFSACIQLSRLFLRFERNQPGASFPKLMLRMLRSSAALPANRAAQTERLQRVLRALLEMLSENTIRLRANWCFGLRVLRSLATAPQKALLHKVQTNDALKSISQEIAAKCTHIGLCQAATAFILFFQTQRRCKTPNGATDYHFSLTLRDHRILRHNVELTLRRYLERRSCEKTAWETTLLAAQYILRPLRKTERVVITPQAARRIPTAYYAFATCCLFRWANAHMTDQRAFFQLLCGLSPLENGVLRPAQSFVRYPTKNDSWAMLFRKGGSKSMENSVSSQREAAAVHLGLLLERCVSHGRLWQQAFGVLMRAIRLGENEKMTARNAQKRIEHVESYAETLFSAFDSNGPNISEYVTLSEACANHAAITPFSSFGTTIHRLCAVHSVDMTMHSILPKMLPLLESYSVSTKFVDELLRILCKTVLLHKDTPKGTKMLHFLASFTRKTLPNRYGYALTKDAASSMHRLVQIWNTPLRSPKFHFLHETSQWNGKCSELDSLAYQWREAIRRYQQQLYKSSEGQGIASRKVFSSDTLQQLLRALRPSLQPNFAVPPNVLLSVLYVQLRVSHAVSQNALAKLIVLLSIGCKALGKGAVGDATRSRALEVMHAICRLRMDLQTAYHVKSLLYSMERKRVDVDALTEMETTVCVQRMMRVTETHEGDLHQSRMGVQAERFALLSLCCAERCSSGAYFAENSGIGSGMSAFCIRRNKVMPQKVLHLCHSMSQFSGINIPKSNLIGKRADNAGKRIVAVDEQIFSLLCAFAVETSEMGDSVETEKSLSPAVALGFAVTNGQLSWKTLRDVVFKGNTGQWLASLSAARLLEIDILA